MIRRLHACWRSASCALLLLASACAAPMATPERENEIRWIVESRGDSLNYSYAAVVSDEKNNVSDLAHILFAAGGPRARVEYHGAIATGNNAVYGLAHCRFNQICSARDPLNLLEVIKIAHITDIRLRFVGFGQFLWIYYENPDRLDNNGEPYRGIYRFGSSHNRTKSLEVANDLIARIRALRPGWNPSIQPGS